MKIGRHFLVEMDFFETAWIFIIFLDKITFFHVKILATFFKNTLGTWFEQTQMKLAAVSAQFQITAVKLK